MIEALPEQLAALIRARHEVEPLPRIAVELRDRLDQGLEKLLADVDGWYSHAVGEVPQLIPDEAGAPVYLQVLCCEVCGTRGERRGGVLVCPDHPSAELGFIDYPVRKLPDGFEHLRPTVTSGITRRFLRRLQRDIENQRQATVLLTEVGLSQHNGRVVLGYAAQKAGMRVEDGRFSYEGTRDEGLVRFHADPDAGVAL